jgi:hypothetical protein
MPLRKLHRPQPQLEARSLERNGHSLIPRRRSKPLASSNGGDSLMAGFASRFKTVT